MNPTLPVTRRLRPFPVAALMLWGMGLQPLTALDLGTDAFDAQLDITLSVGGQFRLEDPDPALLGIPNGGEQFSVNADNGNLNYAKGLVALPASITADLELSAGRFGAFFRGTAFYDTVNSDEDREREPLSDEAEDRVAHRAELLDAYVWGNFDVGTSPLNLRLGKQVLNWGESTFIPNGISTINPVDVSKLRSPGAELREAYLPVWMASGSWGITDNITLEAFYQFDWEEVIIDAPGTYFSTNDFVGRGGERVYLGFGNPAISDQVALGGVPRGPDTEPPDSGQYGLALRVFAPNLNTTEFGFYFIQYHSRLPVISARTPTDPISLAYVQAVATAQADSLLVPQMVAAGIPPETIASAVPSLLQYALGEVPVEGLPADLAGFAPFYTAGALPVAAGARQAGFFNSAATGRYLIEYPEDIKVVGISFNTDLADTGISLQGEISYRWDQPMQIDDVELLFAALTPINLAYVGINQITDEVLPLDTYVRGYIREEIWQAQATATRVFGPTLGASQLILLGEFGANYVPGLPDTDDLRMDGPGTFLSGDPNAEAGGASPGTEPADAFADKWSMGYRIVARLDYNNLVFNMNVSPSIQFAHDVSGNTPLPVGNFLEDRKTLTVSASASYQFRWNVDISYTNYFGAGGNNLLSDRDFISMTLKYSF